MLEADQTPRTWCNPRRKLEVFKKIIKREKLAKSFYKPKINQSLFKYFKIVFANKETFIFLVIQIDKNKDDNFH